jgi:hypothetical protein
MQEAAMVASVGLASRTDTSEPGAESKGENLEE